jgi:hypothetical protein
MQRATILKVQGARPAMVQARPAQRKATVVRSAPKDGQIDQAVKEAEEACAEETRESGTLLESSRRIVSREDILDGRSPRFVRACRFAVDRGHCARAHETHYYWHMRRLTPQVGREPGQPVAPQSPTRGHPQTFSHPPSHPLFAAPPPGTPSRSCLPRRTPSRSSARRTRLPTSAACTRTNFLWLVCCFSVVTTTRCKTMKTSNDYHVEMT